MISNSSKGTRDSTHRSSAARSDDGMAEAIRFVTHQGELPNIVAIEDLRLLGSSAEARRCNRIRKILGEYGTRTNVPRPLSIAVFGPPGSGKSRCVGEIVKSLKGKFSAPVVVNLSQLATAESLADTIAKKLSESPGDDGSSTRVFFFDEFDASLEGESLGWLRWFLSPMQDSEFFSKSKTIATGKAVFMFAGGTAGSFDEFRKRAQIDPAGYVDKKVPDFISRLHGFIDIQGINNLDSERTVRRALVLRHQLDKRWPDRRTAKGAFPIDEKLVESLLSNVHFIHGARSMEALLDMCQFGKASVLTKKQLPDNDLRELHLSRGLLDGQAIGISAGQEADTAGEFLRKLTAALLKNGANLAYGGAFVPAGTLDSIVQEAGRVPDELVDRPDKRIRNYLGYPTFHSALASKQIKQPHAQVEFLRLETLSKLERQQLGVPLNGWFKARSKPYNSNHHLAWAVSLFRMRVRLIQDISALIVLGGKDEESWGRFSGIAEEVVLALTLGKPVYVMGGRGGAAHAVGRLLGLGETLANPDRCLADVSGIDPSSIHKNFSDCFTMPGHPNLPRTISELRNYLFERSVTTPAWPWNGLSQEDNRKLFRRKITGSDGKACVEAIVRGLCRLDWKRPQSGPNQKSG